MKKPAYQPSHVKPKHQHQRPSSLVRSRSRVPQYTHKHTQGRRPRAKCEGRATRAQGHTLAHKMYFGPVLASVSPPPPRVRHTRACTHTDADRPANMHAYIHAADAQLHCFFNVALHLAFLLFARHLKSYMLSFLSLAFNMTLCNPVFCFAFVRFGQILPLLIIINSLVKEPSQGQKTDTAIEKP